MSRLLRGVFVLSLLSSLSSQASPPEFPPIEELIQFKACSGALSQNLGILKGLLQRNAVSLQYLEDSKITPRDILYFKGSVPELSRFNANGDTLQYGDLLSQALKKVPPGDIDDLIDFGAGSSAPTMKALLENPDHSNVHVTAIDVDSAALEISSRNATRFGLEERFHFVQQDLIAYLRRHIFALRTFFGGNVPYLPTPESLSNSTVASSYNPVDGGSDGTKYLEAILTSHKIPSGSYVALSWSSLTNLTRMMEWIERGYDWIYLQAFVTPFGAYTGSDKMLPYLIEQKKLGNVVFFTDSVGRHYYILIGAILKKR